MRLEFGFYMNGSCGPATLACKRKNAQKRDHIKSDFYRRSRTLYISLKESQELLERLGTLAARGMTRMKPSQAAFNEHVDRQFKIG